VVEIFMPKAGMDMKEGTLIRWLKEAGEPVEKDEPIMEIETDKITMEAEAPGDGILLSKIVEEGSVVPVLSVLGYIGEEGEEIPEGPSVIMNFETPIQPEAAAKKEVQIENIDKKAVSSNFPATPYAKMLATQSQIDLKDVVHISDNGIIHAADVLATPLAKRIAKSNQVNLTDTTGTGYHGKITKSDVLSLTAADTDTIEIFENPYRTEIARKTLKGVRKIVGKRMYESYSQVPTVMQSMKVDMTDLIEFRRQINEGRENKISLNDFIIKATAIAVKEMPHVRSMIVGEELVTYAEANIGFAVAVEDGLYVPVIKNADLLSIGEISRQARELAGKARNSTITPDEYSGGTFSVTNMGMYDVYTFNPIINQPESGILGITGIGEVLRLADEKVVVRQEAILCMSYDHRVMDGVGSAKLKQRVKELLEHPIQILI